MFCALCHTFFLFIFLELFHYVRISNSLDKVLIELIGTIGSHSQTFPKPMETVNFIFEISCVRFNLWTNFQLLSHRSFFYRKAFCAMLPQLSPHYLCSKPDLNNPACVSISMGSQNWILFFDFTFFCFCLLPSTQKEEFPPKRKEETQQKICPVKPPAIPEPLLYNGLIRFVLSKGDCPLYEVQEFLFINHQTR